ncbi:MAG: hypothetical protein COW71_05885 [Ignavibacteriales bacterium CG18_big_fil_WC_8_21_14_2_50_31_20]|nr:MAG: hypothetical protein COW71_05885 [Ignavibacteriales bacterium CG18_big_fil_WC_8_21_14_2_50_31_20]
MKKETPKLAESFNYFKRLLFLIKPYWGKLAKGMSLSVVVGVLGMVTPYLTKLLIDEVYPSQDVKLMHVLVGGVLAISITSTLVGSIQGYFNLYVNSKLSNSISVMFFNHLQHLKVRFFDEHRIGEIMSRFGDVSKSLNTVNNVLQTIFVNGIYLLLVPPFLFLLNWKLAIVALISIPFTVITIAVAGKFLRKYWKKTSEAYADLNAFQFEMLTHIRAVKSMVLENFVYNENKKQIENAFSLQLKAGGLGQLLGLSNGFLNALNITLFTWLGWTYILSNEMSLGDYIAFTAYIGYLRRPISQFVNLFSEFQQSAVNLNRMFEYLDSPTEINPTFSFKPHDKINYPLSGKIKIKDLTFGYNPAIKVLKNINIIIEPFTKVSIVGPSGSGKTSLLRLLTNMETPQSGNIYFDEKSISEIPLHELRKQISVIWQEFSMFKGSIRDNLTIGRKNVDDTRIRDAIEISRMSELISTLPEGINTPIAEWGASLSGGQRQRLAIARAIIKDTPIFILDEATSNIDMKAESEILKDLFNTLNDKTIIFVTHRLSTARLADKVCFIEAGKLVDFGSHDELLNRCVKYNQMYLSETNKNGLVKIS